MAEDIRSLTAELARDPDSLAFLELGEALRVRGRVEAAAAVARAGLERHPQLADSHDLFARIHADAGNPTAARESWEATLRIAPRHPGALKGLAFLSYQEGDPMEALELLETALSVDPSDPSVVQALRHVRGAVEAMADARERGGADIFAGFEGADHGLLLVDARGLVLSGALRDGEGRDVGEEVAAYLAGASQEAERASRLLDLGPWRALAVEAAAGQLHLSPPTAEAVLLVKRERAVPSGRVALVARRAGAAARAWLEAQRG